MKWLSKVRANSRKFLAASSGETPAKASDLVRAEPTPQQGNASAEWRSSAGLQFSTRAAVPLLRLRGWGMSRGYSELFSTYLHIIICIWLLDPNMAAAKSRIVHDCLFTSWHLTHHVWNLDCVWHRFLHDSCHCNELTGQNNSTGYKGKNNCCSSNIIEERNKTWLIHCVYMLVAYSKHVNY